MSPISQSAFEFTTPEIEVERAVAELRYGRPVLLSSGERKLAVLALDAVAPSLYDPVSYTHLTLPTNREV